MNWLAIIGFVALIALVLSVVVFVFTLKRRVLHELPDGDYVVSVMETRNIPRGVATVFKIEEPKEFKGHTVTIVKEKTEDEQK